MSRRRNTRGKKISQLRRSVTSHGRKQPSLGESLALYLRGNEKEEPIDYSMYDKEVLDASEYRNTLKAYKAYLINGDIVLEQDIDTATQLRYDGETKPTLTLYRQTTNLFELTNPAIEPTGPDGTGAFGTGPSGTSPSGTHPSGTSADGTYPSGTGPSGTGVNGTHPSGTGPSGTRPSGTSPDGTYPSGTGPSGTHPDGVYPDGTGPSGTYPSGTGPSGTYPSGTGPNGTAPPASYVINTVDNVGRLLVGEKFVVQDPSGISPSTGSIVSFQIQERHSSANSGPTGFPGPRCGKVLGTSSSLGRKGSYIVADHAGSASSCWSTEITGTGPFGTAPSGTHPSGTYPSGTGPDGTGADGTGVGGTGPSGTMPSGTGTGPSGTRPNGTHPSGTGPDGTGRFGTHPSGTGPSGTSPSGTGPSGTQPSGTGLLGTGACLTGPAGTKPTNITGRCDLRFSKYQDGPRGVIGGNTQVGLLTDSSGRKYIQVKNSRISSTGGGSSTADLRTVYIYSGDSGSTHSYSGSSWPYVLVEGNLEVDSEITATITKGSGDELLIDGKPAYQYVNDSNEKEVNGIFGSWSAFALDGSSETNTLAAGEVTAAHKYETGVTYEKTTQAPFVNQRVRIHLSRTAPSTLWYYDDCQKDAGGKIRVKNFNKVGISDDKPAVESLYDNSWQRSYSFDHKEAVILPKSNYNKAEDLIFDEQKKHFSIGFWARLNETGAKFGTQDQYAFDFSNIQGYFTNSGTKFTISGLREIWGDKDPSYHGQNWILESKAGLNTKEWNHYAISRDRKQIALYVNGKRCDSVNSTLAGHKAIEFNRPSDCLIDKNSFSTIGCSRKIEHFLGGKIDDFLVYNSDYYPKFGFIPENSFGSGEFPRREYASFKEGLQAQFNQNIYAYSTGVQEIGPDSGPIQFPNKDYIIDRNSVHNFNQSEHYIFPFFGQNVILTASHEFDHLDPEGKPKVTFYKNTGDGPKEIANNHNSDYYPTIVPFDNTSNQNNNYTQGKYEVVSDLRAPNSNEVSRLYKTTGDISGNGYHLIIKNASLIDTGVYTVKYETASRSWAGQRSVSIKNLVEPEVASIKTEEPLLRMYVQRSGTWYATDQWANQSDCSYNPGEYNNAQAWKASGYLPSLPDLVQPSTDFANYTIDNSCLAVHIVSTNNNMCGVDSPEELYARIPYNELTGYKEAVPSHLGFGITSGYSLNSVLSGRLLPFCSQHERPDLCVKIVDECAITGASVLENWFHGSNQAVKSQYSPLGVENEKVFCASKPCETIDCGCPKTDYSWIDVSGPIRNNNVIGDCYNIFKFDPCKEDRAIYTIWFRIIDTNDPLGWQWHPFKYFSRNPSHTAYVREYHDYQTHYHQEKLWKYQGKVYYRITSNATSGYGGWGCDYFQQYEVNLSYCARPPQPTGPSGTGPSGTGPSGTGPSGTGPSGSGPSGTGPSGTGPSGTGPSGTGPSGTGPSGTGPSGSGPSGTGPSGTGPSGTGPSGTQPSGTGPSGTGPSGTGPSGTGPSGTGPSGSHPPSGSGTGPSGTGPSGTGPSGTQPSGTGPSGTGPSGSGPSGTGPSGSGPSGTGPSGTKPSGTGPSGTGPSGSGPSGTGPSGTQPSGTGPSGTGPSGTKPSGTGPSGTGPSGTGPSGSGPSGTGPSGTGPSGSGPSGTGPSGTGPSGTGPSGSHPPTGSGTGPSGTGPSGTGPSGTSPCQCPGHPDLRTLCDWHNDYDYFTFTWCWNGDTPGNSAPDNFGAALYVCDVKGIILDPTPVFELTNSTQLPEIHHFQVKTQYPCKRYYKLVYKDYHCDIPVGSKSSRQGLQEEIITCESCSGTGPSGTGPSGTGPSGSGPSGTGPSGTGPSGTGPSGTGPSGSGPSGTGPSGTGPSGTGPSGSGPSGTGPSGTKPSGTGPSGTGPSGSGPSGTGPSGTGPSGTGPSGTGPSGSHPPSGSGTGPSGTGPSGTGPSGTGPSGTGPSGTGPSGTGPSGTGPSGTGPSGTGPSGSGPSGTGPSGTGPSGTGPSGTGPSGTGPSGTGPSGTGPSGTGPSGTGPSGTGPSGSGPSGTGPSGTGPSGTGPSGTGPSGTGPSGTGPSGTGPSGTGPSGTGPSGTGPSGTGPSGSGPSGTGPSGTGPSGTGPSGTGPSGTGPSGTGPSGTGPSGTGPSGTGPSGTGPSGSGPSGTGPSGTGPSGTGPSGTGPSGTGPSGTGPSGTGPSGTGPSGTGPSGTGPSGTGPSGTHPPSGSGTGPSGTQPSGTGPSGTYPSGTGPSGTQPGGTQPSGTHPAGTHPAGTHPAGTHPGGTSPAGTHPAGTHPAGTHPAGTHPAGTHPAGTHPGGTHPGGTFNGTLAGSGSPQPPGGTPPVGPPTNPPIAPPTGTNNGGAGITTVSTTLPVQGRGQGALQNTRPGRLIGTTIGPFPGLFVPPTRVWRWPNNWWPPIQGGILWGIAQWRHGVNPLTGIIATAPPETLSPRSPTVTYTGVPLIKDIDLVRHLGGGAGIQEEITERQWKICEGDRVSVGSDYSSLGLQRAKDFGTFPHLYFDCYMFGYVDGRFYSYRNSVTGQSNPLIIPVGSRWTTAIHGDNSPEFYSFEFGNVLDASRSSLLYDKVPRYTPDGKNIEYKFIVYINHSAIPARFDYGARSALLLPIKCCGELTNSGYRNAEPQSPSKSFDKYSRNLVNVQARKWNLVDKDGNGAEGNDETVQTFWNKNYSDIERAQAPSWAGYLSEEVNLDRYLNLQRANCIDDGAHACELDRKEDVGSGDNDGTSNETANDFEKYSMFRTNEGTSPVTWLCDPGAQGCEVGGVLNPNTPNINQTTQVLDIKASSARLGADQPYVKTLCPTTDEDAVMGFGDHEVMELIKSAVGTEAILFDAVPENVKEETFGWYELDPTWGEVYDGDSTINQAYPDPIEKEMAQPNHVLLDLKINKDKKVHGKHLIFCQGSQEDINRSPNKDRCYRFFAICGSTCDGEVKNPTSNVSINNAAPFDNVVELTSNQETDFDELTFEDNFQRLSKVIRVEIPKVAKDEDYFRDTFERQFHDFAGGVAAGGHKKTLKIGAMGGQTIKWTVGSSEGVSSWAQAGWNLANVDWYDPEIEHSSWNPDILGPLKDSLAAQASQMWDFCDFKLREQKHDAFCRGWNFASVGKPAQWKHVHYFLPNLLTQTHKGEVEDVKHFIDSACGCDLDFDGKEDASIPYQKGELVQLKLNINMGTMGIPGGGDRSDVGPDDFKIRWTGPSTAGEDNTTLVNAENLPCRTTADNADALKRKKFIVGPTIVADAAPVVVSEEDIQFASPEENKWSRFDGKTTLEIPDISASEAGKYTCSISYDNVCISDDGYISAKCETEEDIDDLKKKVEDLSDYRFTHTAVFDVVVEGEKCPDVPEEDLKASIAINFTSDGETISNESPQPEAQDFAPAGWKCNDTIASQEGFTCPDWPGWERVDKDFPQDPKNSHCKITSVKAWQIPEEVTGDRLDKFKEWPEVPVRYRGQNREGLIYPNQDDPHVADSGPPHGFVYEADLVAGGGAYYAPNGSTAKCVVGCPIAIIWEIVIEDKITKAQSVTLHEQKTEVPEYPLYPGNPFIEKEQVEVECNKNFVRKIFISHPEPAFLPAHAANVPVTGATSRQGCLYGSVGEECRSSEFNYDSYSNDCECDPDSYSFLDTTYTGNQCCDILVGYGDGDVFLDGIAESPWSATNYSDYKWFSYTPASTAKAEKLEYVITGFNRPDAPGYAKIRFRSKTKCEYFDMTSESYQPSYVYQKGFENLHYWEDYYFTEYGFANILINQEIWLAGNRVGWQLKTENTVNPNSGSIYGRDYEQMAEDQGEIGVFLPQPHEYVATNWFSGDQTKFYNEIAQLDDADKYDHLQIERNIEGTHLLDYGKSPATISMHSGRVGVCSYKNNVENLRTVPGTELIKWEFDWDNRDFGANQHITTIIDGKTVELPPGTPRATSGSYPIWWDSNTHGSSKGPGDNSKATIYKNTNDHCMLIFNVSDYRVQLSGEATGHLGGGQGGQPYLFAGGAEGYDVQNYMKVYSKYYVNGYVGDDYEFYQGGEEANHYGYGRAQNLFETYAEAEAWIEALGIPECTEEESAGDDNCYQVDIDVYEEFENRGNNTAPSWYQNYPGAGSELCVGCWLTDSYWGTSTSAQWNLLTYLEPNDELRVEWTVTKGEHWWVKGDFLAVPALNSKGEYLTKWTGEAGSDHVQGTTIVDAALDGGFDNGGYCQFPLFKTYYNGYVV